MEEIIDTKKITIFEEYTGTKASYYRLLKEDEQQNLVKIYEKENGVFTYFLDGGNSIKEIILVGYSELPNIKLKAATDILDRAGHAAVRTLRTENIHAHFTADEISDIKKRAREVGLLTDAIYEEDQDVISSKA